MCAANLHRARPRWLPATCRRRSAGFLIVLGAILVASIWLTGGCSVEPGVQRPNLPPETVLTFAGPVDTVNSHVRLRWWGEDPDGEVAGYEYRWTLADQVAGEWVFTAATTDSFALPAPAGRASHLFEVRTLDDAGDVDPSPAEQRYHVWNLPPHVRFTSSGALPLISLPAVTISFVATDPDGDDTVHETVAWLDGQDALAEGKRVAYPEVFVTFGPDDFSRYGERTIFLMTLDDAAAASDTISHQLEIIEPVGTTVLFDDMPDNIAGGVTQTDPFYLNAMTEVMGGEPFTVHKLEDAPFRTASEADAIFALFDVVVWYQGTNTVDDQGDPIAVPTFSLTNAAGAIRDLMDRGGRMLLVTMNAVGTGGAFDADFAREVLGVEPPLPNPDALDPEETNFFLQTRYYVGQPTWFLDGQDDGVYDDVRVMGFYWGVELMTAATGGEAVYEIPADIVFEGQERATVATRRRDTGTMIYLGFPLSRCSFQQLHQPVIRGILQTDLELP